MNSETQLLEKFGSEFVSQGHAELVNLLNPVRSLKRATIPAAEIKPSEVDCSQYIKRILTTPTWWRSKRRKVVSLY